MTMKKALKFILPVLVIAMLVGALAIFASAAETTYMTVTDSAGNVTNHTNVDFTAGAAVVHQNENINVLIDWILSDEGQDLIEKVGYVSIN